MFWINIITTIVLELTKRPHHIFQLTAMTSLKEGASIINSTSIRDGAVWPMAHIRPAKSLGLTLPGH